MRLIEIIKDFKGWTKERTPFQSHDFWNLLINNPIAHGPWRHVKSKKRIKNSVLTRLSDLMWGFRFDLTCLQDPYEKWMSNQKKNEFENLPIMLHDFMSWQLGESNSGSKLFVILNRYKAIMIVCQCKQAKLTSSWVLVSISQGNA